MLPILFIGRYVIIPITRIITKLNEWSADGTFQDIASKATDIIGGMITAFSTLSTFISQNKELIILIIEAIGLYVAALEVSLGIQAAVNGYKKIESAYTTAQALANGELTFSQWALNAAMSANPIGMVVLGLTAVVGALVLAYKHSETFRNIIDGLWTKLKDFGGKVVEVFDKVKNFIGLGKSHWDSIKNLDVTDPIYPICSALISEINDVSHKSLPFDDLYYQRIVNEEPAKLFSAFEMIFKNIGEEHYKMMMN
mgnify:CR=1 FL=1